MEAWIEEALREKDRLQIENHSLKEEINDLKTMLMQIGDEQYLAAKQRGE